MASISLLVLEQFWLTTAVVSHFFARAAGIGLPADSRNNSSQAE
ncbi:MULTISPECIES: hypothetical protein [unclassified Herbaspirillum]|nr:MULTISPECIES: hypothetical protein [unclassified Herbaspirillum]MBB5393136.1 hypothetical protein [Herbaspirillum sp. SJZ102]